MTKIFGGFLVEKLNFSVEMIHKYEWFLCNFVFKTMLLSFDIFKKPWVLNSLVTKSKLQEGFTSVILKHEESIIIFRNIFYSKKFIYFLPSIFSKSEFDSLRYGNESVKGKL